MKKRVDEDQYVTKTFMCIGIGKANWRPMIHNVRPRENHTTFNTDAQFFSIRRVKCMFVIFFTLTFIALREGYL